MVVWLKLENGEAVRLVDRWSPSIFVAAADISELSIPLSIVGSDLAWTRVASKYERITDRSKTDVVEAKLKDARRALQVGERIERLGPFGAHRLYNVDVPPGQSYLYEKDIFPLAECEVTQAGDRLDWDLNDDVWSYEYTTPNLRKVKLDIDIGKEGKLARFTDRIRSISLDSDNGRIIIDGGNEADKILELVQTVREADPDFILTDDGDTFLLPYLVKRAEASGVGDRLRLDRDGGALRLPKKGGTSYFQYGRVHYKPSAMKLCGRLHIDVNTSFAYSEAGFEGLFELSRICRMPMQTSSRASIGKALSSLQFYHASKTDLLVPWKPTLVESFKNRNELLVADRGGFIFEPKVGVHENVGELDFHALYPNIMLRKNISAETVRCSCCIDSKNRVPELGWNVCERHTGIVPRAIEIVVKKRLGYKERKAAAAKAGDEVACARYNERQAVLKWIGVTCLPRDSPVLVKQDGTERFVRIGDFIDGLVGDREGVIECPPGVSVAGIGEDYRAKYSSVTNLIKKPNHQNLLSVEMEDGRKIVTTPDHQFFVLREGGLKTLVARDLKEGEAIPVATKIPSASHPVNRVDLIESLRSSLNASEQLLWRVSGGILKEEIRMKANELHEEAAAEGYSYQAVASWVKTGILPLRFFGLLNIRPELHSSLNIGVGRRLGGRVAWLPAVVEVDEGLGFFLGLYVSDGSATKACIRIDIASAEPELLDVTRKLVESLFGVKPRVYKEKKAQMHVVQINSASLVAVLERVFGLQGSAEKGKLKVPGVIFNCEDATAYRFIAGMVAGDGHTSRARRFVSIATASKGLQEQLSFLVAKLGLVYRLATNREGANPLYTVDFVGPETLGSIASWEYSKENKREMIQSWSHESPDTCNHARYTRIPAAESGLFMLAKTTRTSSEPHVYEEHRTCPTQARMKLERMSSRKLSQAQLEQKSKVEKLLDCDLGFVRIRKVETLSSRPEYVYCFQVADGDVPGFFTGEGLVFTHNCFGYLGFNNAKFGRIDAHIAVCAWDRKILVDTARIAERRGFEVIHGIVDSLWVKREDARETDYLALRSEIESETGFAISFEGVYKWVVFLPSKVDPNIPVLNRYFGAYRTGELKVRGIEARRHDTPQEFKKCQMEILQVLAGADTVGEARSVVHECVEVFLRYARALERHEVPASDLAFTTNLSKGPNEYSSMTVQHAAIRQLVREGAKLHAGEGIRYVITDYKGRDSKRATPVDVIRDESKYDAERYIALLAETCASVLEPFDQRRTAEGLLESYESLRSSPLA